MAIPMLKETFFGCCTLKTGSKIIAWISVVLTGLILGYVLASCISILINVIRGTEHASSYHIMYVLLDGFIISLMFPTSIINLIGVQKEKAGYLKPWFIGVIIVLFVCTRELLIEILFVHNWRTADIVACTVAFTIIGLGIYALLIEYSYYRLIRNKPIGSAALV